MKKRKTTRLIIWMIPFFLSLSLSYHEFRGGDERDSRGETISSPVIIKDSVTLSTNSQWPEDTTQVAESYGIPVDWGSYYASPFTAGNFIWLKYMINSMHRREKLYVHYISTGTLGGALEDILPDLIDCAAVDIDGSKIKATAGGLTRYQMDMNEEGWQNFLKSEIKLAIDAGADGIVLDDIQAHVLRIGWSSAGVFNEPDMEGFREFLKGVYSSQELASKFGISDINSFHYGDYIRNRGHMNKWKNAPYEVPLYHHFKVFEYQSTLNVYKNIIQWAKDYAQSNYGKSIVFLGNTSNGLDLSIPFEECLDLAWLEFPYLQYAYPPSCKVIPVSKLRVDNRWKKGTYLTQVPTNADLYERGNPPNISKIFLAEAYASKCEYQIPYKVVGGGAKDYSPDLSILAPYYQFIDENRSYYGKDWSWKSKVAIFYPVSYLELSSTYFGAGLALFDAGIQYDVIFSGDDRMMENKITLSDLLSYPVIVLSDTQVMTSQQVQLILDYVKNGGTVVGWGALGTVNEFWDFSISRPSEWKDFWSVGVHDLGNGRFINLSTSDLGDEYFEIRSDSIRNQITDAISLITSPEISSTAPSNINFLVYSDSSNNKFTLHILNYNYNIGNDSITPFSNFTVKIRLPEGFSISGKTAKLLSPDFTGSATLNYSIQGDSIILTIPTLNFYDLLVIE